MNTNSINKSFFIFLFAFFTAAFLSAQEIVLYGNVSSTSADGSFIPVAGAYVGLADSGNSDHYDLTDEAGNYEFSFLWNWDGPVSVICEAEGYDTQTATVMPEGEVEVELNFVLSPSQQQQNGVLFGSVTYQVSPTGPVMPVAGASIGATPSWGPEPWFQTETNEEGHYELELWANDAPWIVYCTTEFGQQEAEVVITAGHEIELNFHFNAGDEQPEAPYDLMAEYNPSGDGLYGSAILNWEYNSLDPTESLFHIYLYYGSANVEWMLAGESSETYFEYIFEDDYQSSEESCFKVTAISNGEESEPSNTACISMSEPENGVVYGTVYEMSLDPDEVIPIAGAVIHFFIADMAWAVVTGDNGGYEISLPAGTYQVWVEAEGYFPNDDESVTVIPNEEVEQNFYLQPHDDSELVLRGFVRGQSEDDPSGWQPLHSAHIRAVPNDQEEPVYETETNAEGFYELPLPAGFYDVTATYEGYDPGSAYVHVGPNNENWHDFYLEYTGSQNTGIYGIVSWITLNGNEIPVPGAQIRAEAEDANIVYETESGEGGGYEMEVQGNHYYLVTCTIQFAGMEMIMAHDVFVGNSPVELNFVFGDDQPQTAGIYGHVFMATPDGEVPIPGAHVIAYPDSVNAGFETFTNEDGSYEMEVTSNTHYFVTCLVETPGGGWTQTQEIYVGEYPVELNFVFGEEPPLNASIFGHVSMVNPNGYPDPVPGAELIIMSENGEVIATTETNEQGFYQVEVDANNQYIVTCTIETEEGPLTQTQECYVGEYPLELIFIFGEDNPEGAGIRGHVGWETPNGGFMYIPGAEIIAQAEDASIVFDAVSDEDGFYAVEVTGNFHYMVTCTIEFEGISMTQVQDVFVGNGWVNLDFIFGEEPPDFGWLVGIVHDSNPESFPIPGATVMAYNVMGEFITETNEGGFFEMDLPPAMGYSGYQIVVQAVGFQDYHHLEQVYIYPNEETILEIMMEPVSSEVGHVYGMVIDGAQNYPISGAVVWAINDAHEFETHSGSQGQFDFELPPGVYELSADAEGYTPSSGTMIEIEVGDIVTVNITLFPHEQMEISVDYMSDWNLVGLPLEGGEPGGNCTPLSDAFGFTYEGYTEVENLVPGAGYWLRFSDECTEEFSGDPIGWLTFDLMTGWNLISGISYPTHVSSITDYDGILVPNTVFGFDESGYTNAEYLEPGRGYWVRTYEEGQIIISSGIEDNSSTKTVILTNHLDGANTISFNGKSLHFGVDVPDEHRLSYSLPPKPFSGAFDVRFSGGCTYTEDYGEIELQGTNDFVTVQYDIFITAGEYMNWVLVDGFGTEYILDGSGTISISGGEQTLTLKKNKIIPKAISLYPAYPNPFNPVTTIRFSLPVVETLHATSLQIYDITGKLVETLVDGAVEAGHHSISWNAGGVPSGVYFVHLESGSFSQTQKLILMK